MSLRGGRGGSIRAPGRRPGGPRRRRRSPRRSPPARRRRPRRRRGEARSLPPSEDGDGARWIIRVNEGGQLRTEVQGGNIIGTTLINDGFWHHIAVVVEDDGSADITEVHLYVDGNPEEISASVDEPVNTGNVYNVRIGVYDVSQRFFKGLIDEVRIYDRPLSEAEIQQIAGN